MLELCRSGAYAERDISICKKDFVDYYIPLWPNGHDINLQVLLNQRTLMTTVKTFLRDQSQALCSIGPKATVLDALQLMADKNIGALPIIEEGRLVGIFSERDYARKVILRGKRSHDTLIEELMTTNVFCVSPHDSVAHCMRVMSEKHIRHLPVLEESEVVGMITIRDVVKILLRQQAATIRDLEGYIQGGYSAQA